MLNLRRLLILAIIPDVGINLYIPIESLAMWPRNSPVQEKLDDS